MVRQAVPPDREISVSEARANLAELVAEAQAGTVIHLTRQGKRVAAIVPAEHVRRTEVRDFARGFADRHRDLLDRLADS